MPIPVLCPGCNSRLNAPDAAAGKTVKCPKCQTAMVIPAPESEVAPDFEVMDDEPSPPKKPAPKSTPAKKPAVKTDVQVDDDDDDRPRKKKRPVEDGEDDDDDRPRKKKGKKPAKKRLPVGLLVGGGLALLLLLGGCGFAVYWFALRDKGTDAAGGTASTGKSVAGTKGTVPTGWQELAPPGWGFKTVVPQLPKNAARWKTPPAKVTTLQTEDFNSATADDKVKYIVTVYSFPDSIPPGDREKAMIADMKKEQEFPAKFVKESTRTATLGGRDANEIILEIDLAGFLATKGPKGGPRGPKGESPPDKLIGVVRCCVVGDKGYMAVVATVTGGRAPEADEKAFFDNFEFTK